MILQMSGSYIHSQNVTNVTFSHIVSPMSKMSQNVPPDVNDTNDTFSMSQMSQSEQMSKMSVNGTVLRVLYGHSLPPVRAHIPQGRYT